MGSIIDGQLVNALVTNNAKLDRLTDDTAQGRITLSNTLPESGLSVDSIQKHINAGWQDGKLFLTTATHQKVTFDGNALQCPENMLITSRDWGVVNIIPAASFPISLNDGDSAYVTLSRQANATLTVIASNTLPQDKDVFRLCTRLSNALIFWDNTLVRAGKSARLGESGSDLSGKQEIPTGIVNGTNANFTLSAVPLTAASIIVFIDGQAIAQSGWSLSGMTLTMQAGSIPAPGQSIYCWYVVDSVATSSSTGAASGIPQVEYRTLTNTEATNKQITLIAAPGAANKVMVDIIGGGAQQYGVDYSVSGSTLVWSGMGLDAIGMSSGDVLRVHYFS